MKARFLTEQQPVKVVDTPKYFYVFICLNGEKKSEYYSSTENEKELESYIEYDYTELIINKENQEYDIEDIKLHPEKYLDINDSLNILKRNKIAESKVMLKEYLASHPLFSKAKYDTGRYYTVTEEKQRQLTSKMAMYNIYKQKGLEYPLLKWNDVGNVCEEWSIEELTALSIEIDEYVTPLVSKQQSYEHSISNMETEKEVKNATFSLK